MTFVGGSRDDIDEHIHYLKVVQKQYSFFQPEIRRAIDYAIHSLSRSIPIGRQGTSPHSDVVETSPSASLDSAEKMGAATVSVANSSVLHTTSPTIKSKSSDGGDESVDSSTKDRGKRVVDGSEQTSTSCSQPSSEKTLANGGCLYGGTKAQCGDAGELKTEISTTVEPPKDAPPRANHLCTSCMTLAVTTKDGCGCSCHKETGNTSYQNITEEKG